MSHIPWRIAALDVNVPIDSIVAQMPITNVNWLATNEFLHNIRIHPGDELLCLGYPFGISSNEAGYPILRSGKIASYPITPLELVGKILYDFRVFPGNSGGPVYLQYTGRVYKDTYNPFKLFTRQKIFGLVIEKANPVNSVDPLIGIIIPANYIKDVIDKLAGFESTISPDPE